MSGVDTDRTNSPLRPNAFIMTVRSSGVNMWCSAGKTQPHMDSPLPSSVCVWVCVCLKSFAKWKIACVNVEHQQETLTALSTINNHYSVSMHVCACVCKRNIVCGCVRLSERERDVCVCV